MSEEKLKILRPKASRIELGLGEIWEYRELLYFLTWRQIKTKYKQTAIGIAWVVLQPLITMAIFALIFYRVANLPTGGIEVYPFLFSTLMLWTFFSSGFNAGSFSLISNSGMISKIYFPRVLLPLSVVIAGLLDYGVAWIVFLGIMLLSGESFSIMMVFILIPIIMAFLLSAGLSFFFSALAAKYRDVQYIVPFMVSVLLFASPIIYPITWIQDPNIKWLMILNPLTGIMTMQRLSIFGRPDFDMIFLVSSILITLAIFFIGLLFFKRYERQLADVI